MKDYKEFFINMVDFDEESIVYVKPKQFLKVCRNVGIYYKKKKTKSENTKSENTKQKIIFQTPKLRVPFGLSEYEKNDKKYFQLCLSLTTLTNLYNEQDIIDFYNVMEKIDSANKELIRNIKKDWILPKKTIYKKILQKSNDFPHYISINLPYDKKNGFYFHVYDENAKKASMDIIKNTSIVSAVIELTDIIFTDTKIIPNWTMLQLRKFKPYSPIQDFFMSGCFICDEDDPDDTVYDDIIERYKLKLKTPIVVPPQYIETGANKNSIPIPPPPIPPSITSKQTTHINRPFAPSLEDLLNTKSLLKKTETNKKEILCGKVIEKNDEKVQKKTQKKIVEENSKKTNNGKELDENNKLTKNNNKKDKKVNKKSESKKKNR